MTARAEGIMISRNLSGSSGKEGRGTPYGPKAPGLGPGWTYHPAAHLYRQPKSVLAGGGDLWLDQDPGVPGPNPISGQGTASLGLDLYPGRLQPGVDAQFANQNQLLREKQTQIYPQEPHNPNIMQAWTISLWKTARHL